MGLGPDHRKEGEPCLVLTKGVASSGVFLMSNSGGRVEEGSPKETRTLTDHVGTESLRSSSKR